jgi:hypothetical protein
MPKIISVDDAIDPRIEPHRDIREHDLVGRTGCFMAESGAVIDEGVNSAVGDRVKLRSNCVLSSNPTRRQCAHLRRTKDRMLIPKDTMARVDSD